MCLYTRTIVELKNGYISKQTRGLLFQNKAPKKILRGIHSHCHLSN